MRLKYNLHKVASKRSYTSEELVEVLGVHRQTIRKWKRQGLNPLPGMRSPYLFLGSEIKQFLSERYNKVKVKLKQGEFYCLRCRKAVSPQKVTVIDRNKLLGSGKKATILQGDCPLCGLSVRRFSSESVNLTDANSRQPPINKPENEPKNEHKSEQKSFFDITF